MLGSESGKCVRDERLVNPWTVVSVRCHNRNSTKRVGLVQSKYHHHLIDCFRYEIGDIFTKLVLKGYCLPQS